MRTSLNQIVPSSQSNSSQEARSAQPRLSAHAQPAPTAGSKRSAASAGLDALAQRPSPNSPAVEESTEQTHKRPRLDLGELSRRMARTTGSDASTQTQALVSPAASEAFGDRPSDAAVPSLPNRRFDPHESHHLPDILRRLETLHHDYGAHLTPEAVDQLRHEIRQLHDIAKMVLDIKRRLMRRMK
jgi:hypothetical protein